MSSPVTSARRRVATVGAVIALAAGAAACGSDDPAPEVPEGGTGSAFNDAIIASESHDEVLLDGGTGEMVVAVDCDPDDRRQPRHRGRRRGSTCGVRRRVRPVDRCRPQPRRHRWRPVRRSGAQMTLDAEEYTVTFADIDGAVFTVRGCSS